MTIFKINNFFIFIVLIFSLSLSLYSQDNNWVIRIRDSQGELKKLFTVNDFMQEVSNIANLRGLPAENLNALLTNDLQLWQFVSTLIEQELIYIKAVEEGFDKDEELTLAISQERDNQIAQLYMQKKVRDDFSVVSEEEKRNFFNNNRERLQAARGNNVRYEQVAMDIEYTILQERMRNEYEKMINEAKTNYKLEYSPTKDPCIIIDDKKIPLSNFNEMFNQTLKQAGANIPPALRVQARDNMFTAFVAREIMIYEANKVGFYNEPEAKAVENYITRSAVVSHYIDKTIRATIEKPTKEEINQVYEQYGKLYRIDSLPYAEAQKALETLVIEAKTQQKYQLIITDLRYRYNIEKNLSLVENINQ
ncbi:peptidylprolyl isomerase [Brachyspira aalborgi]|uniref:Peptidylprolyl isomerase n=1 Tax=Brachyspira aalborgi TaxID=29522 RepID=A0A5C8FJN0_9SPIR|nr:peptidylprolyl isomerase [Brachyspira aalborgi]TXJ49909.1 peptidylprolyl isomerase [Brachyspira aalborgi]